MIILPTSSVLFAAANTPSPASLTSLAAATVGSVVALSASDLDTIRTGGLCIKERWIDSKLTGALRDDILSLSENGCFERSGLTPRLLARGIDEVNDEECGSSGRSEMEEDETDLFGESDRRVFVLSPHGNENDVVGVNRDARIAIYDELEKFRVALSVGLDVDDLILGELYYSLMGVGTRLPVHIDEHHPATRHAPLSDMSHRRCVSFLLYLSDESILSGGELRAYPRMTSVDRTTTRCGMCGSHGGNLQIGWLDYGIDEGTEEGDVSTGCGGSHPVYLDAWVPPAWMDEDRCEICALAKWEAVMRSIDEVGGGRSTEDAERDFYDACQPLSRLYTVRVENDDNGSLSIMPITERDISHDDSDFAGTSIEPEIFVEKLRVRLSEPHRCGFGGLMMAKTTTTTKHDDGQYADDDDDDEGRRVPREGRRHQAAVDVEARGGTLVLFDSVCVPHEVLPVKAGMRLALGGWFHEPSRSYPSWYDAAFSAISAYGEGGGV